MTAGRRQEALAVVLLLAALAAQLAFGLRTDGVTNDEVLYIAAGWRHLTAADFTVNPTTPPLAKLVAAVPLLPLPVRATERRPGEDELAFAYRFLHVDNDATRLLRAARWPAVALTLLLALVVWAWAREAGGRAAGLLALALVAFHTSLLAHGHLATTDLPSALAWLVASWAFWRWLRSRRLSWAAAAAAAVGAAAATRLTGWLLLPTFAALGALELLRGSASAPAKVPPRRSRAAAVLALWTLLPPLVVWTAHGFRSQPAAREERPRAAVAAPAVASGLIDVMDRLRLLPASYLEGARYQAGHGAGGHPAYLLGERSRTGWWHYFAVAFLVKNTPGFLLAVAVGLVLALAPRLRHPDAPRAVHWLLPAAVVFVAASAGRVQIGERYILAVYPYLILAAAAGLAPRIEKRRAAALAAVAGLAALHVLPAARAVGGGALSYFNLLAGGRSGGHRVLLDSNLDWGQDLPRLGDWMRRHGVAHVQLGYHGSDDPRRVGIAREDLPGVHLYRPAAPARPFTGVVAVSPNLLGGLFPRLEADYAGLRERRPDDRAGVFFIYRMTATP